MLNVDLLRGYYTGHGVKVALIDTGISAEVCAQSVDVRTYAYDKNEDRIKESPDAIIYSDHGTSCGKMILTVAPQATVYSINVEDETKDFTEEGIAAAIRFAVSEGCRVINLSIGFLSYSDVLFTACREAYEQNVVVVTSAAHGVSIVFPADFDPYTLKVLDNQNPFQKEEVKRIDHRTFEVSFEPLTERHYDKDIGAERTSVVGGSSLASAYLAGLIALYIESRPFLSPEDLLKELFDRKGEEDKEEEENVPPTIEPGSLFTSLATFYDCADYPELADPNLAGIFYPRTGKRLMFEGKDAKENCLYVINPLAFPRKPLRNADFEKQVYIGNFEDTDCYQGKVLHHEEKMRNVNTPVILIVGVGQDCSKFNVQLELHKQLNARGLSNYCMTYNPLGWAFGMEYLSYPAETPFQSIVYSINQHIKDIEDEEEYECFLIDVAGGMFPLSRANTNDFGMLYHAYLNAAPADYVIICSNSGVETDVVKKEIARLRLTGNMDISIVISNLTYDELSVDNTKKTTPHVEDKEVVDRGIEEYRRVFPETPVFGMQEVEEGKLFDDIMGKLS